jgi:serine/threonine-protein kinase
MEQAEANADPLIGRNIGNYEVKSKLGEGGMGSVYLAEHPLIGKKVALKVLHPELSSKKDVVERFFHEAKAVNDIQHPNIVDIVDYGVLDDNGNPLVYFIMEFLSGRALTDVLAQDSPLPPDRALHIALQIADALSASHNNGVVHRDLKPDNIMLIKKRHESDFVKVLDFGIAKLTGDKHQSRKTRTGIVMGTPAYMSPEQCEGKGLIDHRTDVYALGIVLYEMITGRVPFQGEGYGEVLVQHLTQPPVKPTTLRGVIPPHVEAIVLKALEKNRELRFPTMNEFMLALANPVSYVDAHGGVNGFLQSNLVDSGAPPPQIHTPRPTTTTPYPNQGTYPGQSSPYSHQPTPPPGQVFSPAPGQMLTPSPGQMYTPSPGALPGMTMAAEKKKPTALIAALGMLALGAATAGFLVTRGGGEERSSTTEATQPAAETPPVEAVTPPPVEEPDEPTHTVVEEITLTLEIAPEGAEIYVNGEKRDEVTPAKLKLVKSEAPFEVVIKKEGFEDLTLSGVDDNRTHVSKLAELPKAEEPKVAKGKDRKGRKGRKGKDRKGKDRKDKNTNKRVDPDLMRPDF